MKKRLSLRRLFILSIALMICQFSSAILLGQTTTSTIEGYVKDANGAVVTGATVKAAGSTVGTERTATTDANGFYRLAALPAGTYTVTVSQSGFATSTSSIELTVNRTATLDVQMQVGNVVGSVNVTGENTLLEPTTSSAGQTITPRQIQD